MGNIRLTVFDIFSYLVPGFSYIVIIVCLNCNFNLEELISLTDNINFITIGIYSFFSYLIGFISDAVASFLIPSIIDLFKGDFKTRIIQEFNREYPDSNMQTYHYAHVYAYVNNFANPVREKVDQFSAMSGLARNLSLTLLVFVIVVLYYTINNWEIVNFLKISLILILSLIISVVLMFKSDTFKRWSHAHLLHVYYLLTNNNKF